MIVTVREASAAEQPVVANLFQLYAHDFSEIIPIELDADGRFGYPWLDLYWSEPGRRIPYLIRADEQLAGFALVQRGSLVTGDPDVWDMAEFFVARRYRRQGIGEEAAAQIWRLLPGRWEVRVMTANAAALPFWARAVSRFLQQPSIAVPTLVEKGAKRWNVFSFNAASGDAPLQ